MSSNDLSTNTTPFFMKGNLLFTFSAYGLANHVEGTRGSCLTGPNSINRLLKLCADNFSKAIPGYRDGVIEIPVPCEGFVSAVRILEPGDELVGSYRQRPGDASGSSRKIISTTGEKSPAKSVSIIMYRSDVLAEDEDNTLPPKDTNWEVVMVNASPIDRPLAMPPLTMLANLAGEAGGTYTPVPDPAAKLQELIEAFHDWKDKALVDG